MKLLVVGADGFIGGCVMTAAALSGCEAIGTSRKPGKEHVFFDLADNRLFEIMTPKQLCEFDAAIICAAIPKINQCYHEQKHCYQVNVSGTELLISQLLEAGIKPVFLSSDQVFNGLEGYYNEFDRTSPLNEYGRHKALVEEYLLSMGGNALVLRLSLTVGDRQQSKKHVLDEWYEKAANQETIYCIKDQVISPTLVEDVANGIIRAVEDGLDGLYNLVNQEFFSRYELAFQFCRALGLQADISEVGQEFFGFPEKRPAKSYLDGSKFRNETGMRFASMSEVFQRYKSQV